MMVIYIFAIFSAIFIQNIVVAEESSKCVPLLTRPGRPLPCSSNLDCECFNLAIDGGGICAAALISCSNLHDCDLNNKTCSIPNTVCVISSRCNQPVCYPLALASPQVCPQISPVTPTPIPTIITTPSRFVITYPIVGVFDTVVVVGDKFILKLIQLVGANTTPYLEILNSTNAASPISINSITQTVTLSNLNNLNVILYFKTLKQVIYNDAVNRIGTINIQNLSPTNVTLGSGQQATITATNELNVSPGCCGVTNVSSLGTVNVALATNGGFPDITIIGENVKVQGPNSGVPKISVKAQNTADISVGGIPTCYIEAGSFMNITTTGISTIYGKASTSTMSANLTLSGISSIYMGVSNKNGTKTGYSCPKTVTMKMEPSVSVYVCATEKINVNGYGGTVYYQGSISDSRTYGNKFPF